MFFFSFSRKLYNISGPASLPRVCRYGILVFLAKQPCFRDVQECKRLIGIIKIVLPVIVVSFYIYVELLELVTGHNEIQIFF